VLSGDKLRLSLTPERAAEAANDLLDRGQVSTACVANAIQPAAAGVGGLMRMKENANRRMHDAALLTRHGDGEAGGIRQYRAYGADTPRRSETGAPRRVERPGQGRQVGSVER
jgi:hypothetical protein